MAQKKPGRGQTTINILSTVRSEKQDFLSKLNSFSLLRVIKDGRTILNISVWPALVALAIFFVVRAVRSRLS